MTMGFINYINLRYTKDEYCCNSGMSIFSSTISQDGSVLHGSAFQIPLNIKLSQQNWKKKPQRFLSIISKLFLKNTLSNYKKTSAQVQGACGLCRHSLPVCDLSLVLG